MDKDTKYDPDHLMIDHHTKMSEHHRQQAHHHSMMASRHYDDKSAAKHHTKLADHHNERAEHHSEKAQEHAHNIEIKHPGAFHKYLGKSPDKKVTSSDIAKGKASPDPHVRKMATFAANAKKWHH